MDKVSVIIPLFNKEKYIRCCLDSVVSQMYKHVEIIVIDDGSTDLSEMIVKEYIKSNNNADIRLISQANRGPSAARNVGIANATGKYVLFLDADDYITSDCISYAVKLMKKNDYDLVEFSFSENDFISQDKCLEKCIEDQNEIIKALFRREIKPLVCGGLYKTELVKQCSFIETMKWGEDSCFKLDYLLLIRKAILTSKKLYINRVLYDNTLSRQNLSVEKVQSIMRYISYYECKLTTNNMIKTLLYRKLLKSSINLLGSIYIDNMDTACKNEVKLLKNKCKKYVVKTDIKSLFYYIIFILMLLNKSLYIKAYHIFKIFKRRIKHGK